MLPKPFKFCQQCAHALEYRVPDDGDDKIRAVCPSCGHIHYSNPLIVVGTIPVWLDPADASEEKVLLCLRNIEPRKGYWTLPAGFMELGESCEQGALRETVEEAGLHAESLGLFSVYNVLRAGQVHLFYRLQVSNPSLDPGPETVEAKYYKLSEIPWEQIAFPSVAQTLRWYIAAKASGDFSLRSN